MPGDRRSARTGLAAAAVVCLVLFARLAAVYGVLGRSEGDAWIGWVMAPDSRDYVYMADDLSDGRLDSVSFRTPIYPLLIALTQHLLSKRWLATILVQQIAVALTAAACWSIVAGRSGRTAASVAAIAYMVCPLAIIESVVLLPDILLGMAVAWAGVLWLRALDAPPGRRRIVPSALSGLLLGAATLVKPSVFLLLLVPPAQLLVTRGIPGRDKVLTGAAVVLAALCLPVAWRVGNLVRFGSPFLTTQDSFELAGRFLVLSGRDTQESFWLRRADSLEMIAASGPIVYEDLACTKVPQGWAGLGGGRFCPSVDIARRDSLFRSIAVSTFMQAPLRIIAGHFDRWPWFLANPVGDLGRAGGSPALRAAVRSGSMAFQIALAAGALLALLRRGVRTRASRLLVFSALTFVVVATVTGPLAGTRYSLPFYWALVSVAACGWTGAKAGRQ